MPENLPLSATCAGCGQARVHHAGPKRYGACPGGTGRQARRFRRQAADKWPAPLVVRDKHGEAWMNLGDGAWAPLAEVARGRKCAESWPRTWAALERGLGPLTVEWRLAR